jgi:DNA-directed RNA polymerase specialized sigma24 family protein
MTLRSKAIQGAEIGTANATRHLTRCVHAYASGDARSGERLFTAAHAEVLPLVQRVVSRHLDSPQDKEDAEQAAMLLIWRDAQSGKECVVEQVAFQAAVDVWRKSPVIGNLRSLTPEQRALVSSPAELGDEHHAPTPSHADAVAAGIDADRFTIAFIQEVARRRPLWGMIALALSEGKTPPEIATMLGKHRGTINSSIRDMREYLGVE